ncbi:MAG: hypothetical protein QM817_14135 [Archangium sp.]
MGARFKQLEGESGAVWKEPPGPDVADLEGEEFEDAHMLSFEDELDLLEACLERLGFKVPWHEYGDSDVTAVQKLASRLKPIDWDVALKKGVEMGDDEELAGEVWEKFRAFVIDAARSCNAIEWEVDEW